MCTVPQPKLPAQVIAPAPATSPDGGNVGVRMDEKRRAALANGPQGTLLTGAQGLTTPPQTANVSLLGG